ncbi:G-alpha-domain-containing protein [Xylaria acuta]|nr:G-alpha-domain-containing protein [Xylaria acuta]
MVQAALDQLKIWNKPEYSRDPRYRQLALQIGSFLDCFSLLILTLEGRLEDFERDGSNNITAQQKFIFLWGEKETSEYSSLLDRQVNALNLLLQAVQCMMFDFDAVILASRIYQKVGRSHLRQAIRAGHTPSPEQEPKYNPSLSSPLESPTRQQQSHRVATLNAEMIAKEPRESITSESSSSDQNEMRRMSSPPLSKSVKVPSWTRRPRVLDLWRRALRQKADTDSIHNTEEQSNHGNRRNIMILGTSETGKSTLLKGLKLVLGDDYTIEERLEYNETICSNIIQSIRDVLEAMESLGIPLEDDKNEYHGVSQAISSLWLDSGFQSAYERRWEYQLNDNTLYYATAIRRLAGLFYIPTTADILRSRIKTTGITETKFPSQPSTAGIEYRFYDPGGTRSERKKWIHVYKSGISTVIFTVDTTSYPKPPPEDKIFKRSNFIVIFTKMDLLEDCLRRNPVQRWFPDYLYEGSGLGIVEHYMEYLELRFLSLINSDEVLSRTRAIRANLVDFGNQGQGMEVIRILNELTAM